MRSFAVVCAMMLVLASAVVGQGPATRVEIVDGYGLALSTSSQAMHYASDVSFEGGRVHARAGVAELGSNGQPPAATSATEVPLQVGAWYAVNDRQGRTYVLHVVAEQGRLTTVELEPAKTPMRLAAATGGGRGVVMPTYRGVPMPTYRGVPAPTYGGVPAPSGGSAAAPKPAKAPAQSDTAARPAPQAEPPLPPLRGETVDLAIYRMEGQQLTKYYFLKDGTFRREFIGRSALGSVSHEERGDYAIQNGVLTLRLAQTYTAATGGIPNRQYMSGGQSQSVSVETHRIRLQGANSAVIDGVSYQHLTW